MDLTASTVEHTATIVSAYLRHHSVAADQIPAIIASVHAALGAVGAPIPAAVPIVLTPAVPVRRSVRPNEIVCLECGYTGQMLKRHLTTSHGLTVDAYRAKWGLAADYPMVAPAYATRRSALAKQFGLGRRPDRQLAVVNGVGRAKGVAGLRGSSASG